MISNPTRRLCIALVLLAILCVISSGCTPISHVKIDDWPVLKVVEHRVPHGEMLKRCQRYYPGGTPVACAEWNFNLATCDIWFSKDLPEMQHVVEHERMHCEGHDHPGSTAMEESLRKWRQR